jgi:hypothetical protein
MREMLQYMLKGETAMGAAAMIGKDRRWLWRMRRSSPLFSGQVQVLDRIAKGLLPGQKGEMKTVLKERYEGSITENELFTPKQRRKMERDLVNLKEKEAFLQIFRETTKRTEALDRLGLTVKEVVTAMEEDPEFAQKMDEEQMRILWDIEDNEKSRAKENGASARFLLKKKSDHFKMPERDKGNRALPSWADEGRMKNAEDWAKGDVGFSGKEPNDSSDEPEN